jgi:hypothetical protein
MVGEEVVELGTFELAVTQAARHSAEHDSVNVVVEVLMSDADGANKRSAGFGVVPWPLWRVLVYASNAVGIALTGAGGSRVPEAARGDAMDIEPIVVIQGMQADAALRGGRRMPAPMAVDIGGPHDA